MNNLTKLAQTVHDLQETCEELVGATAIIKQTLRHAEHQAYMVYDKLLKARYEEDLG